MDFYHETTHASAHTFFCMTIGLFHAQTSFADSIPVPNTKYSALKQVVTAQGSFVQTVHHSHGKERSEMLDGINITKYKLVLKDKSAGGFIWLSPENIALKMDFISKEGKDKNRITMTLKNLKIEPQDAALFELPEGYQPMPSMGNMMKSFKPQ